MCHWYSSLGLDISSHAVFGLPLDLEPGVAPWIISFSRQILFPQNMPEVFHLGCLDGCEQNSLNPRCFQYPFIYILACPWNPQDHPQTFHFNFIIRHFISNADILFSSACFLKCPALTSVCCYWPHKGLQMSEFYRNAVTLCQSWTDLLWTLCVNSNQWFMVRECIDLLQCTAIDRDYVHVAIALVLSMFINRLPTLSIRYTSSCNCVSELESKTMSSAYLKFSLFAHLFEFHLRIHPTPCASPLPPKYWQLWREHTPPTYSSSDPKPSGKRASYSSLGLLFSVDLCHQVDNVFRESHLHHDHPELLNMTCETWSKSRAFLKSTKHIQSGCWCSLAFCMRILRFVIFYPRISRITQATSNISGGGSQSNWWSVSFVSPSQYNCSQYSLHPSALPAVYADGMQYSRGWNMCVWLTRR